MKHFRISLVFLCILALTSCGSKKNDTHNAKPPEKTSPKYFSKFTGESVDKATFEKAPIMAIIENSLPSRPQSGVSQADIVYETVAEGGIPRFIALFQKNDCKKIGPIRSARPYFLDISQEYNLPFAHCGGSSDALTRIVKENAMSINEIAHEAFFHRDNNRLAPHNLYTSTEEIRTFAKDNNYVKDCNVNFTFDKNYWEKNDFQQATDINLKINRYYSTNYKYDGNNYTKYMDNKVAFDACTDTNMLTNTLIIQITDIVPLNDELHHVKVNLVGNGEGYIFSNGKFKKMIWSKKDKNSQTLIKDEKGNPIPLNCGKTWWNIVDKSCEIKIQ